MHFLNFHLKIFYLFLFFKDIFAGYKILGFSGVLRSLEDVISLYSGFYFSLETSVVCLPVAHLKVMFSFYFLAVKRWLTEKPNKTNTSTAKLIQKKKRNKKYHTSNTKRNIWFLWFQNNKKKYYEKTLSPHSINVFSHLFECTKLLKNTMKQLL